MPIYTYKNLSTGKLVEKMMPISKRDELPGFRRQFDPPQVPAIGLAVDPNSQPVQMRNALKAMEEEHGHEAIVARSGFTTEHLKQTWKEN